MLSSAASRACLSWLLSSRRCMRVNIKGGCTDPRREIADVRPTLVCVQASQVITVDVTEEACQRRIIADASEEVHCVRVRE
jgi:hypothetical protein